MGESEAWSVDELRMSKETPIVMSTAKLMYSESQRFRSSFARSSVASSGRGLIINLRPSCHDEQPAYMRSNLPFLVPVGA